MYNYHNHTFRCGHASGTDEDYIKAAIRNGYTAMGFSDHAPYIFPKGHHSGFRIQLKDAEDYTNSVRQLQEKYKDKIDIKLGYEVEYYPQLNQKELEYLATFKYDYLILGQHFTDNEYESYAKYSGSKTDSVATLDKYISQLLLGAKSGYFTYVAHPDLINFTGDHKVYLKKMRYMIEELKKLEIPLELNYYGYVDKRQYPNREFWEIVAEVGNPVVIGIDAHAPSFYDDQKSLEEMKEYLKTLGITPLPLEKLKLINYKKEIG